VCLSFELLAEKQCVPYSSCNEIIWLQENQEVQTHLDLNGVNCGYEREPLVWCNIDDMTIGEVGHTRVTEMRSSNDDCSGHLQVYFVSRRGQLQLAKLHTRRRRNYSRLSRISNVYRVAVQGNCCWKLHQRPNFRGEFNLLDLGYDSQFNLRFASAQAVEC